MGIILTALGTWFIATPALLPRQVSVFLRRNHWRIYHPGFQKSQLVEAHRNVMASPEAGACWRGVTCNAATKMEGYWERQVALPCVMPTAFAPTSDGAQRRCQRPQVRRAGHAQTRHLHERALASSSNGNHDYPQRCRRPFHRLRQPHSPSASPATQPQKSLGKRGDFWFVMTLRNLELSTFAPRCGRSARARPRCATTAKTARCFWNELHLAPVRDLVGHATTHFVSVINDVSDRIRYQHALSTRANHDSLTGLRQPQPAQRSH